MGFFDSGTSSSGITEASRMSPAQQALLSSMISQYSGYAGGKVLPSYTGELTAGLTGSQTQALSGLSGLVSGNTLSNNSTINNALQGIISGTTEQASADAMRKLYENNVEAPLLSAYKDTFEPSLDAAFAAKGLSYGSDKESARASKVSDLMDSLAIGRATLESNILQNLVSNQLSGISAANSTQSQQLQSLMGLSSAGQVEQQTNQAQDTALYNQWLRNQPGTNPAEQQIMQLLGLNPVTTQSQSGSSTQSPSGWSNFSSILGTVGGLAAIAAALI